MKKIIPPITKEKLLAELTKEKFVRHTNNGSNEIYSITNHDSPNVMLEIGRLREMTFRAAGGGTGEEVDIDHYDTDEKPYHQLIVWSPADQEILGGYRYIIGKNAPKDEEGNTLLATSHLFGFSENFETDYIPYMIELGRSFVRSDFGRKALFALDNLWDGLGALIGRNPDIKYLFGKVTMYTNYNVTARNYILCFFDKYFTDKENLLTPHRPIDVNMDWDECYRIFTADNYKDDYKTLSQKVRELGETIPPLINSYMNLSPSMKTFGTVINDTFGDVEETGIMITINDIYEEKKQRYFFKAKS